MWYQNIGSIVVSSQCTRVTDGQTDKRTDRLNYEPQDITNIATLCGKNARIRYALKQDRGLINVSLIQTGQKHNHL